MSLNAALSTAVSGLQTNQTLMRIISANISSANVDGYTKKRGELETTVLGGIGAGVSVANITRTVDQYLLRETNTQTSNVSAAEVLDDFYRRIQDQFGSPDQNTSIAGVLNDLHVALEALTTDPARSVSQYGTVTAAQNVANAFQQLSDAIQKLRSEADRTIDQGVDIINDRLQQIADLNRTIVSGNIANQPVGDFLDKRDTALRDISQWLDIRWYTRPNGDISVMTGSNYQLLDTDARTINYTAPAGIGPATLYPAGFNPISIDGVVNDLTTQINSGKLKSLIDLRDTILPDLQQQLDQLAGNFAEEMNRAHNSAMPVPGLVRITGTRGIDPTAQLDPLNPESIPLTAYTDPTTSVTSYGSFEIAITDSSGNAVGAALRVNLDEFKSEMEAYVLASGGGVIDYQLTLGDIINMINGAYAATPPVGIPVPDTPVGWPGIVPWPPNPPLVMPSTGSDIAGLFNLSGVSQSGGLSSSRFAGVVSGQLVLALPSGSSYGLSIDDTHTTFDDGNGRATTFNYLFGLNDLFVIPPTSVSAASDITVRNDIVANPSHIGRGYLTSVLRDPLDPTTEEWFVALGDGAGALAMANVFNMQLSFTAAGNLPSSQQSVTEYAADMIQSNANAADTASNDLNTKQTLLTTLNDRMGATSGVNIDEELAYLISVQNSYAASARVVNVVNSVYEDLLRII